MHNVMLHFKQIHLFRQIEELINYCNFLTRLFCRRNVLPAFLNKRSPQEYNLKCNSCYVQLAFFWGDEIKSIVKKAQQEKVYSYINSFSWVHMMLVAGFLWVTLCAYTSLVTIIYIEVSERRTLSNFHWFSWFRINSKAAQLACVYYVNS